MDGLAKKAQSCIIGMQGGYAFDTKPLAKVPSEEQLFTLCASRWSQMPRVRDRAPWGRGPGAGEERNLTLARERNLALARNIDLALAR